MRWILLSIWIIPAAALATVQYPEVLICDGKELKMCSLPLEDYIPHEYDRSRPRVFEPTSSACHRGYVGTWEIKDGRLFLLKILVERSAAKDRKLQHPVKEDVLSVIFPGKEAPLPAVWYSGVLRIPAGEWVQSGFYDPLYENETYVFVDKGRALSKQVFKYDPKLLATNSVLRSEHLKTSLIEYIKAFETLIPVVACDKCFELPSGRWIDIYDVCNWFGELLFSGKAFKTRGIFFPKRLWIPPTVTRRYAEFPLSVKGIKSLPPSGTQVEITATFDKNSPLTELIVSKVVPLRAGEKIHKSHYQDSGLGTASKH